MYIIAEIAQAHDGSLGIAHSYIDALADTGVHAVKFQTHIAHAESSSYEPFRIAFSYEDTTRYDYWKRMEFTAEQWAGLKQHCEDRNMEFISSPFSCAAVDLLENLGVKKYKIGSGEVSNLLMLEKIANTGKDILLSSGLSALSDLDETIAFLNNFNNRLSVFQCTTAYPTIAGQWGLGLIQVLKDRYHLPVGFSDHSGDIFAPIAAAALGAELLEFHVVFDKKMFGPDAPASLSLQQVSQLVQGVNEISKDLRTKQEKGADASFAVLKNIFQKSLSLNKDMKAGSCIQFNDLETKKPAGHGIDARQFKSVLGKELREDKKSGDFLTNEDILL